jgi:hypothetical protein
MGAHNQLMSRRRGLMARRPSIIYKKALRSPRSSFSDFSRPIRGQGYSCLVLPPTPKIKNKTLNEYAKQSQPGYHNNTAKIEAPSIAVSVGQLSGSRAAPAVKPVAV